MDGTRLTREEVLKRHSQRGRSNPFSGCVLQNLDLKGADLAGADFRKAVFIDTDLSRADLAGAKFSESRHVGTDFRRSMLWGADFGEAELLRCDFTGVRAWKILLFRSSIIETRFDFAILHSAKAICARIAHSSFRGASLKAFGGSDCFFLNCDFTGAFLGELSLNAGALMHCQWDEADLPESLPGTPLLAREDAAELAARGVEIVTAFGLEKPAAAAMDEVKSNLDVLGKDTGLPYLDGTDSGREGGHRGMAERVDRRHGPGCFAAGGDLHFILPPWAVTQGNVQETGLYIRVSKNADLVEIRDPLTFETLSASTLKCIRTADLGLAADSTRRIASYAAGLLDRLRTEEPGLLPHATGLWRALTSPGTTEQAARQTIKRLDEAIRLVVGLGLVPVREQTTLRADVSLQDLVEANPAGNNREDRRWLLSNFPWTWDAARLTGTADRMFSEVEANRANAIRSTVSFLQNDLDIDAESARRAAGLLSRHRDSPYFPTFLQDPCHPHDRRCRLIFLRAIGTDGPQLLDRMARNPVRAFQALCVAAFSLAVDDCRYLDRAARVALSLQIFRSMVWQSPKARWSGKFWLPHTPNCDVHHGLRRIATDSLAPYLPSRSSDGRSPFDLVSEAMRALAFFLGGPARPILGIERIRRLVIAGALRDRDAHSYSLTSLAWDTPSEWPVDIPDVTVLTDLLSVEAEGRRMRNCLGQPPSQSWLNDVLSQRSTLAVIEAGENRAMLEVRRYPEASDDRRYGITQLRGPGNESPHNDCRDIADAIIERLNNKAADDKGAMENKANPEAALVLKVDPDPDRARELWFECYAPHLPQAFQDVEPGQVVADWLDARSKAS